MKRSASTVAPQRPLEVNLREYTLDRPVQDKPHHHHHHHRCHHRRERDKKQRSLDRSPSRQPQTVPGATEGDASCREKAHDRGRSHERKHHSSSSEKQRYYSCDRYGSREHCATKSATASCATSPCEVQESSLNKQGSGLVRGSLVTLTSSGASTPSRGRRQLPQTPLTPRPGVAYRTANSSPVHFVGPQADLPTLSPGKLSRGLSEHNALLHSGLDSPSPVTRICSEPFLGQSDISHGSLHHGFHNEPPNTGGWPYRTVGPPIVALPPPPQRIRGMPNGYHLKVGVHSGTAGSSTRVHRYYPEAQEDEWC